MASLCHSRLAYDILFLIVQFAAAPNSDGQIDWSASGALLPLLSTFYDALEICYHLASLPNSRGQIDLSASGALLPLLTNCHRARVIFNRELQKHATAPTKTFLLTTNLDLTSLRTSLVSWKLLRKILQASHDIYLKVEPWVDHDKEENNQKVVAKSRDTRYKACCKSLLYRTKALLSVLGEGLHSAAQGLPASSCSTLLDSIVIMDFRGYKCGCGRLLVETIAKVRSPVAQQLHRTMKIETGTTKVKHICRQKTLG